MKVAVRARRWALWSLNGRAIGYIVFIALAAPAVTAAELRWHSDVDPLSLIRFGVLLLLGVAYGEAFDHVERIRRFLGDDRVRTNHLSVWTIAGVLALPAGLACLLVPCLYAHLLFMVRRHKSARVYRMVLTGSAATVATAAATELVRLLSPSGPLSAGIGEGVNAAVASLTVIPVFLLADTVLVATAVYLATRPPSVKSVIPDREGTLFEVATQVLGVVTGELLVHMAWLVPASIGGLVALHRASLVTNLQLAATTDTKTKLLNAAAWRERTLAAIGRAAHVGQRVGVVLIDLDHFKQVNDVHGHLAGDRVLADVARVIRNETRAADIVGRFGGEEFVVFVDGRAAAAHAIDIATRIRERIASLHHPEDLQVTATIGVGYGVPSASVSLEQLLGQADAALYEGKSAGRDRINAHAVG